MAFATIGTTGIADDAVTSAKVAPGVVDTEAQPNQSPIIINGNMAVSQRGTSFSPNGAGTTLTTDRFAFQTTSGTGDATITQEADAPASTNFRKSLKISPDATETLSGGGNIVLTLVLKVKMCKF